MILKERALCSHGSKLSKFYLCKQALSAQHLTKTSIQTLRTCQKYMLGEHMTGLPILPWDLRHRAPGLRSSGLSVRKFCHFERNHCKSSKEPSSLWSLTKVLVVLQFNVYSYCLMCFNPYIIYVKNE